MNKFFFIFLSIFFISKIIYAEDIFIESDELIITNNPLTTTFIGNVYAFDNEIKLWSKKVIILYNKTDNKIKQIKSFDVSKIIRQDQEIISDNMIYSVIDEKIVAFGNVTLTQDTNIIKGDELKVDLLESTSIMSSKNLNRVKVKINKNNESN